MLLVCGSFVATASAQQAPSPAPPKPQIQKPKEIKPIGALDLLCSITGSEDQAGQKPFQNGAFLSGAPAAAFIHIKVENKGALKAGNFTLAVQATDAGVEPPLTQSMTLDGNSSATVTKKVSVATGSHNVVIGATVDAGNTIHETNEGNNTCSIHFQMESAQ
jgi:hypothetical protein